MALGEQHTPSRSRSSTNVASGCSATNSANRTRSNFGLRPTFGTRAAIAPVSRRRFSDRTQVRLTP